jgi:capsid protein
MSTIAGPSASGESIWGYDGAQITSLRTAFFFFPWNSRREFAAYTRKELVRKIRALDANLAIFGRIARKIAQHSVGKGIFPRPITQDKEWNELNRKRFINKVSKPGSYSIDGSRDFWEDQRIAAETLVSDGEFFEALVFKDDVNMVQPLDVFEIENPKLPSPDERWVDGIQTDDFEAPTNFGVRTLPWSMASKASGMGTETNRPSSSSTRIIPVESMIHIFRRRRARQPRGFTWFYAGVNDGIDCLDLKALEKGTAKIHSALAVSVKRKKGDASKQGISGNLQKTLMADGSTKVDENFWRGAAIAYLAEDEGIELHTSNRASPQFIAWMEFLYREIALATDMPLSTIIGFSGTKGSETRADLESAQWIFDLTQDMIVERQSQPFYVWDTALALQRGDLPACKDPEWWACAWRGPAKLTVDMGRTAQAAVLLMKNAALSHVRYYEERALDAYDEAREQMEFLEWLKGECDKRGLDLSMLIEPTPGAQGKSSGGNEPDDGEPE